MHLTSILLLLIALLPSTVIAQTYQDTIFTYKLDTIICKIDHLDLRSIHYKIKDGNDEQRMEAIDKTKVASVSKDSIRYFEMINIPQNTDDTKGTNEEYFAESNGIIYPDHLESAPVFQGGEFDFLRYMQSRVRTQAQYAEIFGDSYVKVLYEATIDYTGVIKDVNISQSSVSTGNYGQEGMDIQNQIKDVLSLMPAWIPGRLKGRDVTVDVFIPIKFRIEQNAIVMYSGKQAFVFNNRE